MPNKRRGKTSEWARRQNRDSYVKQARPAGFRARSVYKLAQIDAKYRLIQADSLLVDLGAAPGSWSQYAAARVRGDGQIIAVDLLLMAAVDKVHFVRGDFTEETVRRQIIALQAGRAAHLVLSDMAPNLSGISIADQAGAERLVQAALNFCHQGLQPGGALLIKIFAGESAAVSRAQIEACFARTRAIKPDASRAASKELYLLGQGYRPPSAAAA